MKDKTVNRLEAVLVSIALILCFVMARVPMHDKRESLTLDSLTTYSTSVSQLANNSGLEISFCTLPVSK